MKKLTSDRVDLSTRSSWAKKSVNGLFRIFKAAPGRVGNTALSGSLIFFTISLFFAHPALCAEENLRVELRSPVMVMLSSGAAGQIMEITVKDGQSFTKGQVLLRIDGRLAGHRLDMARASRDQADTQYKMAERLYRLNSRGALDVEMARAQLERARAEKRLAEEMLEMCQVKAPFSGRVTQLEVKENQYVAEGAPLMEVAETGPMEIEFMMPSSWLGKVKPGTRFTVNVEEAGMTCQGEIIRLGGKVDAVTQSIRAYGKLLENAPGLLPGMSGTVSIK